MNMSFTVYLKEHLKKNGEIYTVRSYDLKDGVIFVEGVGRCRREKVKSNVVYSDLLPFIGKSGFESGEIWWKFIYGVFKCVNTESRYLYHIIILPSDITLRY